VIKAVTESVSATSIAQVHRATLKDASEGVLKIRRPGIRKKIEADLRLMAHLVDVIELEIPGFVNLNQVKRFVSLAVPYS